MKRSVMIVLLSMSLVSCSKNDSKDCIDPVTYENKCIEQAIERQEEPVRKTIDLGSPTNDPTNIWPTTPTHTTTVIERRVIVEREKPSALPAIGGAIGGWLGKKWADRKAAQQAQPPIPPPPPKQPVRVVPIVPNAKPYVPPPKPVYAPPKPSYTYSKPAYTSPTVTVRPSPAPSYRSAPSVTVRGR